jgi:Ser/Thr protein kinase RdoA (MazF antagonist)
MDEPYAGLTPDCTLDAIDGVGLRTDGRLLALNSFENRVYQAWLEDGGTVIAKFYRPDRWSDAQILEEHAYTAELAAREIPVVAPIEIGGATLHAHSGYRFALYPRRGGRAPELEDPSVLEWLGRFIGRIHAVGATRPFIERPALDLTSFGEEPRGWLLAHGSIPDDLLPAWSGIVDQALAAVRAAFAQRPAMRRLRLHGDCHAGNILWTDDGPHFVDFDDARSGPAIQDFWMLLSGDAEAMSASCGTCSRAMSASQKDRSELGLIEPLRRCADPLLPRGSRGAGTTRLPAAFPGSAPPATGRTASWSCASRWRRCRSRRSRPSSPARRAPGRAPKRPRSWSDRRDHAARRSPGWSAAAPCPSASSAACRRSAPARPRHRAELAIDDGHQLALERLARLGRAGPRRILQHCEGHRDLAL